MLRYRGRSKGVCPAGYKLKAHLPLVHQRSLLRPEATPYHMLRYRGRSKGARPAGYKSKACSSVLLCAVEDWNGLQVTPRQRSTVGGAKERRSLAARANTPGTRSLAPGVPYAGAGEWGTAEPTGPVQPVWRDHTRGGNEGPHQASKG